MLIKILFFIGWKHYPIKSKNKTIEQTCRYENRCHSKVTPILLLHSLILTNPSWSCVL